jgi:anti-anti-sigma factor
MPFDVHVQEGRSLTRTLVLRGRLDNDSVAILDKELDTVLGSAVKVVVFDLAGLEYVTSAGLRSIFRAQKSMHAREGKALILNPQPQVDRVLEIVKVPELGFIVRSVRELDEYLDAIQKKVVEGE